MTTPTQPAGRIGSPGGGHPAGGDPGPARVDAALVHGLRPVRGVEGDQGPSTHSPVVADLAWPCPTRAVRCWRRRRPGTAYRPRYCHAFGTTLPRTAPGGALCPFVVWSPPRRPPTCST
ncbi:hypothetical protein GCM10023328_04720 [Modestobacter marinus]|uniref:Uncharacterized protein n=1 Tax=Modestobacter marinus TaxID=477641 RepID=A0ABQ2FTI9_9ACTN|nr:hypothetical protein GCM10011589_05240 [Modestobacter marinus]